VVFLAWPNIAAVVPWCPRCGSGNSHPERVARSAADWLWAIPTALRREGTSERDPCASLLGSTRAVAALAAMVKEALRFGLVCDSPAV